MKRTEQTLLEQMQITEEEISRRRELLRFGREEAALLLSCRSFIENELETIIEEFFQAQAADEEISRLVGDADTLRKLHSTQRQYVLDLFNGRTDIEYVNNRLMIGLIHKKVGVEPKLYLSALKILKDILYQALERQISDRTVLAETCHALDKLLYFDITLVFDTYTRSLLSEVESAKYRLEVYASSLEIQVTERTNQLEEKVHELEAALSMVKKLQGVIPICGVCKKIRGDEESWQQLEQYISEHSEAMFSHGLCPECYEKELSGIKALRDGKVKKNGNTG